MKRRARKCAECETYFVTRSPTRWWCKTHQPIATGWRDMRSAPRNGTPVLLYATRLGWPGRARVCGFWHQGAWRIYGCANGEPSAGGREPQVLDQVDPSHWRRLPFPPVPKTLRLEAGE